jgi:hypothetical protein
MNTELFFVIATVCFAIVAAFQTIRVRAMNNHYKRLKEYKLDRIQYYQRTIAENNERAELLKRNGLKDSSDYINGEAYHQILKAKLEANQQIPL